MEKTKKGKNNFYIKFLLAVSVIIYFIFGFNHLTKFITSDEHYWVYDRVPQYWEAISNQKWKKTRVNDKPGITLAYVSGIGLLWDKTPRDHMIKDDTTLSAYHSERTEKLNLTFRLPILIFNGFFVLVLFWLIKKVTENDWIALLSSVLMLLSPILLGISQIVNPDSLLWGFSTASIFAFLAFIKTSTPPHQYEKNNDINISEQLHDKNKQHWCGGKRKFAILSSIFLGLALLTKYVAAILFPFLFLVILFYFLLTLSDQIGNTEKSKKKILELSVAYFAIVVGYLVVFSLLMPAVFIRSKYLWTGTIGYEGLGNIFWIVAGLNFFLIMDCEIFEGKVAKFLLKNLKFLKNILPRIFYIFLIVLTLFVLVNWISGN
ncbi:MAG TPA: phospholipid carrier-dependent glycosyltransferase, partial [Candidatus Moranbacteria bacterium]|nr:phospholipid carrier-dependent glycosyltransferase [Candidatus Moranbacteria bacterium]